MLIGGIANLLTNANPLIPLDGYFALGDWLEITNLRLRAKEYFRLWTQRHLLRLDVALPDLDARERRILLTYGIGASAYVTGFTLFLASRVVGYTYRTLGALVAGSVVLLVLYTLRGGVQLVWQGVRTAVAAARTLAARGGGGRTRRRLVMASGLLLLTLAALMPVSLTTRGTYTVTPVTQQAVTAPAAGVIAAVFVREGDAVAAGAPVLRVADITLDREFVQRRRTTDSLRADAFGARARAQDGLGSVLSSASDEAEALSTETRARRDVLSVRAAVPGTVITPQPERLAGRSVQFGDTLLRLADVTHVEAIVRIDGIGATRVRPGDAVRLQSYQDPAWSFRGTIASVAPIAAGMIEARLHLDTGAPVRAGSTGQARVVWGRSTLLGAMLWAVRARLRADLLL